MTPPKYIEETSNAYEFNKQNDHAALFIDDQLSNRSDVPKSIFGNFLEHLGFSIQGGIWAQELSNPVFCRETNLPPSYKANLMLSGQRIIQLFQSDGDPHGLPLNWTPGTDVTGFGVATLDDYTDRDVPFPWAPLGVPGFVSASVGRLDGAVRLAGHSWQGESFPQVVSLDDGPAGIYQGIFPPVHRCLAYKGDLWLRIATLDPQAQGAVEVGFRRRLGCGGSTAGEIITCQHISIIGCEWEKIKFNLNIESESAKPGEPLDFYIRWLPGEGRKSDLLVDRVFLFPADAVEGFDPEVIFMAKAWPVPLLRWPGGNFVSQYHWRDGVGSIDRRPTRMNLAWHGLEYNFIGTQEFIRFCRLIGAEPQITVNTGTGTPEEAADWVEFCNGDIYTPMGKLRAKLGDPEPYNVRLWEVGNEIYGCWQIGYHGADENAQRYAEFAKAMKRIDPSIELIATGNSFDFAEPGPEYDYTHADNRWHQKLIEWAGEDLDIVSLHSLPVNDRFLERLTNEEAYYSLLAQPTTWEEKFLPDLLERFDKSLPDQKPVRLAITEWGILGTRKDRPYVDTYGEAIYAARFLHMMIRNSKRIPIANATALLHGGCIRKVAGKVYTDPQYLVIQKYAKLIGSTPINCIVKSPRIDIETGTDLGRPEKGLPLIDAVACLREGEYDRLYLALVNISLEKTISLNVSIGDFSHESTGKLTFMVGADPFAKATFDNPCPFYLVDEEIVSTDGNFSLELRPCSIYWIDFPVLP